MGKKKRFDKKNSVTFKVVSRSQRDPLIADERAPQNVLLELNQPSTSCTHHLSQNETDEDIRDRREEQRKYGVYFEDDYDYLQHLRDVNYVSDWETIAGNKESKINSHIKDQNHENSGPPLLQLPSSLFASHVEEKEGLLNKAALPVGPQPDWDPDLVAAMDEDFNYDDPNNQIDDDFIVQAGGQDSEESAEDDESEESYEDEDDSMNGYASDNQDDYEKKFEGEETKSHFTNYSMTSSVMRRNEGLRTLDDRFETLYEREYANDCDIGALDFDEIEGKLDPNDSQLMSHLIQEFEKSKKVYDLDTCKSNDALVKFDDREEMIELEINEYEGKNRNEDRFDCESILSTYSNLYNHPKVIKEENKSERKIRINPKTGMPIGVLDKPGLTTQKLAKLNALNDLNGEVNEADFCSQSISSKVSRLSTLSMRSKNETPEERKARKSMLKEYRKERRAEKKANKLAFKEEAIRQEKEVVNLQENLKGIKLL